ncbi:MAG: pilus assembly protein PilM [Deltaproteobacteria bacterium GWC2_42_11]|nr:MAG: pilus assembly protein PilM [Deltaproteobacteria bacterium GWC2_42_11]
MLPFLTKKKDVIGLDIGSNSIKLVQLAKVKKGYRLVKLGVIQLPPEAIVDGSIIDSMTVTNAIKELLAQQGTKVKDAVSAFTGHSVIIKKVALSAMTEDELADSIQWEAEQYIPFPIADVNIDFQILGYDTEGKGQMDVILVAVKKDMINDYVNVIKEAGLNPVVIDVDSFALENMFEANYPVAPTDNIAVVNIGAAVTSINILKGGVTAFTRAVTIGGNFFTEEIQKLLNISFKDAETLKIEGTVKDVDISAVQPVIDKVCGNIALEIKRSIDFYLGGMPGDYVTKIYLSGGCSKMKGLLNIIQERTALPVEIINPFSAVEFNQKVFDPDYIAGVSPVFAVAAGLAMRRAGDR